MSPPAVRSSPGAPGFGARRALAATALLVGGILAAVGLFVHWVRVHYPATAGHLALALSGLVTLCTSHGEGDGPRGEGTPSKHSNPGDASGMLGVAQPG